MDIHLDKFLDKISNLLAFINFKIDINNGILTISSEKKEEKE